MYVAINVNISSRLFIYSYLYCFDPYRPNLSETRNMFCGTWYLPHSQVHNDRTVPIIMAGCNVHA